jgi:hypothetical protein
LSVLQSRVIRDKVYFSQWFTKPNKTQRNLLMIMIRCEHSLVLTGGGIQLFSFKGLQQVCYKFQILSSYIFIYNFKLIFVSDITNIVFVFQYVGCFAWFQVDNLVVIILVEYIFFFSKKIRVKTCIYFCISNK